MKIMELIKTCCACPSQWEGIIENEGLVYIRYRHGRLTINFTEHGIDAVLGEEIFRKYIGHEFLNISPKKFIFFLKEQDRYLSQKHKTRPAGEEGNVVTFGNSFFSDRTKASSVYQLISLRLVSNNSCERGSSSGTYSVISHFSVYSDKVSTIRSKVCICVMAR